VTSQPTLVVFYTLCAVSSGSLCPLPLADEWTVWTAANGNWDDVRAGCFSGYDPTDFKVLVFAVSAGLAGIAGALYTLQSGSASPRAMDIAFSIENGDLGGSGGRGLVGAILGALLVNFARSFLSEQFAEVWLFFQGAVLIVDDGASRWLSGLAAASGGIQQVDAPSR